MTTGHFYPISILTKALMYENDEFNFYYVKNFKTMDLLAVGTPLSSIGKHCFDKYERNGREIYIAVSKNSWFDEERGIREKHIFLFTDFINNKPILKQVNKLSAPNQIDHWKEVLINNKEFIENELHYRFTGSKLNDYQKIIYQNRDEYKDLYELYEKIPAVLSLYFDGKHIYFLQKKYHIKDKNNKSIFRTIKEEVDDFLVNKIQNKDWKESLIKSYENLFNNLTERAKFRILNIIDTYHVSPFFVFNYVSYPFNKNKSNILKGHIFSHPTLKFLYHDLFNSQFINNDLEITGFLNGLPEPYHSKFIDFPAYKNYLTLAKQMKILTSIPNDVNFIFNIIKEYTKKILISDLYNLENKVEDLEKYSNLLSEILSAL